MDLGAATGEGTIGMHGRIGAEKILIVEGAEEEITIQAGMEVTQVGEAHTVVGVRETATMR
jgi:hypothetical protein